MPISPYSRYADNLLLPIVDDGVSRPTIIIGTPDQQTISYSTYTWKQGDSIEYLAYSVYGDEQSWWYIANANPEIMFWNTVNPGTQVRVPSA